LPDPEATAYLANIIQRCLCPKADERPTAREVNLALNGKREITTARTFLPAHPVPPEKPSPIPRPASAPASPATAALSLSNGSEALTFNITTSLGKQLLRQFGDEARFADNHQFTIERRGIEWWLVPVSGTTNYTVLNGKPALTPAKLAVGDRIEIGSRGSGKTVLPLSVTI
jgi:hypothetical protein